MTSRQPEAAHGPEAEPLPAGLVESLSSGSAYPTGTESAVSGPEHVQTHISHVFLTRERVYKLRKAVSLGFLDFGRRHERNADCLREVALNRRLAPDVYLGVAPLLPRSGGARDAPDATWQVGPLAEDLSPDPAIEHCVVMRRLPAGRDALTLLERGQLSPAHLDAVASRLARFHADHGLGRPAPFTPDEWLERITAPVDENFRVLDAEGGRALDPERLAEIAAAARAFAQREAGRFEARRRDGRAVDGHGDVHLQHVWFESDVPPFAPLLIDCIEFREDLRRIDAASEVAFLAMDLDYRDRPDWAERFLRRYAREADDFDLYSVVDYYRSYRAAVRAKVAAIASGEDEVAPEQRQAAARSAHRHLELAARGLEPSAAGALVLVGGVVGTGKSTAAEALADAVGGVPIASDVVRKRAAGLAPTERGSGAPDAGIYAPERTEEVYRGLLERALPVARSGRTAILDATWSRRRHREAARQLAREHGLGFGMVETCCAAEVALDRLSRRAARGDDPSDAGPEFYATSASRYQPTTELAPGEHLELDTADPDWRQRLERWGCERLPRR